MVPSLSIVSTASLTSRMTVTMEACGRKKEETSFEIHSFKMKTWCFQVCTLTPMVLLIVDTHVCREDCLVRLIHSQDFLLILMFGGNLHTTLYSTQI